MRFTGKVCLVTGGGSGIGRATCRRLAAEGGRVLVIGRDEEKLAETVALIEQSGGEAAAARADLAEPAEIRAAVDAAAARWRRVDVVVNNAATNVFFRLEDLPEAEWGHLMAVNLRAVFLMCKYALPQMPAGGAIVNVSSVHAHQTTPMMVAYATAKGGMEAFTRGLALEVQERGIRVNAIAPGAVNTPMLWSNPNVKSGREKIEGAIGEPEDIAAAICFLASDEARFITGATLAADGGRLATLS
jgi:NAD(P)-dependent dehydrogenase (short-subunit alcohol dehydrogenase family)